MTESANSVFVLEGKEGYLVRKDKQVILGRLPDDAEITELNGADRKAFSLREALNLAGTVSLFSTQRAVVINDPFFLSAAGTAAEKEECSSLLEAYCRKPNEDCLLLFVCDGWNADKRTSAFKVLSASPAVTVLSHKEQYFRNLSSAIDNILRSSGLVFTKEADAEIRLRAAGSLSDIYRAIDSFRLYGSENITKTDVVRLMPPNPEADVWRIGEALLKKDAPAMIRAYRDIKEISGYSDLDLIPLIASQIRRTYNVRVCIDNGMSLEETDRYLNIKNAYYGYENSKRFRTEQLLGMLCSLADLEQGIKSGRFEEKGSVETWLLNRI